MENFNASDLQLILLPGRNPPQKYLDHYKKAYQCWREVWEHTYKKELNYQRFLHSDEFTRQDEIIALFHRDACVGMCFLKWVDASEGPVAHDSYFKIWPEIALQKLRSRGNKIIVCSQFTLHFNYRKSMNEISWKDLLMGLVMERFRYSGMDAMTGTMRIVKGMGEATIRGGAEPILRNIAYSSEEDRVDLVAAFRDTIGPSHVTGIPELVNEIFPRTICLVNSLVYPLSKEVKDAA